MVLGVRSDVDIFKLTASVPGLYGSTYGSAHVRVLAPKLADEDSRKEKTRIKAGICKEVKSTQNKVPKPDCSSSLPHRQSLTVARAYLTHKAWL